jgi:ATP-dependent Zn protease
MRCRLHTPERHPASSQRHSVANSFRRFVGVGARRIRDLFAAAKRHSPCIIFLGA